MLPASLILRSTTDTSRASTKPPNRPPELPGFSRTFRPPMEWSVYPGHQPSASALGWILPARWAVCRLEESRQRRSATEPGRLESRRGTFRSRRKSFGLYVKSSSSADLVPAQRAVTLSVASTARDSRKSRHFSRIAPDAEVFLTRRYRAARGGDGI